MKEILNYASVRLILGTSQVELANKLDTTKQTVSNIETGRSKNRMAIKFYKITIEQLISECEDERLKIACNIILSTDLEIVKQAAETILLNGGA